MKTTKEIADFIENIISFSMEKNKFLNEYEKFKKIEDSVFFISEKIDCLCLKDVLDRTIIHSPCNGNARIFFVDQNPHANWAHECLYFFIVNDKITVCSWDMPPKEIFKLKSISCALEELNNIEIIRITNNVLEIKSNDKKFRLEIGPARLPRS